MIVSGVVVIVNVRAGGGAIRSLPVLALSSSTHVPTNCGRCAPVGGLTRGPAEERKRSDDDADQAEADRGRDAFTCRRHAQHPRRLSPQDASVSLIFT